MGKKKKVNLIVVGLNNSGKTTMLNYINPGKSQKETAPTVGFEIQKFKKKNFAFTVFDMSGDRTYSYLWEQHYQDLDGIIFVIDSTDKIRFALAADELAKILNHKELS